MKKTTALILSLIMMLTCFAGCSGGEEKTELVILSWGDYMDPELLEEFKDQNPDLNVKYSSVPSNEEMYTLASTEGCDVDIMLPSDYTIEKMAKHDLIAEIDVTKLENFQYVSEFAATCTFDPESKYSVPYAYGTVGILYNKNLVKEPVTSWNILWNEKYSKKIAMYDSIRDSLAVALIVLGYDINTTNEEELKQAGALLKNQKKLVYTYGTDDLKDIMIAGSCAMAVMYSGDAAFAMMENEDLGFSVPDEGSNIWTDSFVVMKNTDNMEGALRFIDFMLDPENSARNTYYLGYSNPSPKALALLPNYMQEGDINLLENEAFVVTDDQRARCKYYCDLEDSMELYNNVWMDVKNHTAG